MAEKIIYEMVVDADKAKQDIQGLTEETGNLKKGVDSTGDSTGALTGKLDSMTGGAITGFKAMQGAVKKTVMGMKTLRGAVMATGIGALVLIVVSLMQAFTTSEEGQNKWAKAMGMIGAVTGVITDGLAAFGMLIIDVFTKPQEVFKSFGKSIKEFVMDKITKVIDGIGLVGSAIKKAFSGDFSGALDDAKEGFTKLAQASPLGILAEGAEKLAKGISNVVKEMTAEAKIAGKIADMRAKADKLDRALIVDRAEANRKRADLLNKAVDKENYTTKERIGFLKEAGKIEDDITQKGIAAAKLRLDAKIAENALGGSTKDDFEEEANLRATVINLETAKLAKAKEVTTQIIALNAEETASIKAIADAKKAAQKEIDDFNTNTQAEKRQAEKDALKTQFDELMVKAGEDNEAKLELQRSFDERLLEMKNKNADDDAKAQEVIDNAAAAAKKTVDDAKLAADQAVADAELGVQNAKLDAVGAGFGILSQMAEGNKGLQAASLIGENAAGIAKQIINTQAANAVASPLLSNPATAAAGAAALARNKIALGIGIASSIAATAKGLAGLGKGGSPGGGGAAGAAVIQAPTFNTVGQSPANVNSIAAGADAQINNSNTNPQRAYVVSTDVTNQQALDRDIENQGTLG